MGYHWFTWINNPSLTSYVTFPVCTFTAVSSGVVRAHPKSKCMRPLWLTLVLSAVGHGGVCGHYWVKDQTHLGSLMFCVDIDRRGVWLSDAIQHSKLAHSS